MSRALGSLLLLAAACGASAGDSDGGIDTGTLPLPDTGPVADSGSGSDSGAVDAGTCADEDGDGYVTSTCCTGIICGPDCDDADATINPGSHDGPAGGVCACDNVDNDCDGTRDEGCGCIAGAMRECGSEVEIMRIGICRPGVVTCDGCGPWPELCADGRVSPREETCNGHDDDCDTRTDEAVCP